MPLTSFPFRRLFYAMIISATLGLLGSNVATVSVSVAPRDSLQAPTAAFTPGNLVVYRVGNGGSLGSNATAVFLDEFSPTGTLAQSLPMPTSVSGSNRRLTASGTTNTEGFLTRSENGQFLLVPGYDSAPGTGSIVGTDWSATNRVIGRVDAAGNVDTSTALADGGLTGGPRSAASTNGSDLWLTTSTAGIRYAALGSTTSTSLSTSPSSIRVVNVFGGQLYISSNVGTTHLATVGAGAPTTSGQTITNLPGFPTTGSRFGFFFCDLDATVPGLDTVYTADDGGQIQKYSLVSGNWSANGVISLTTVRGLTGTVAGSNVTLYVTAGSATTTLQKLTDTSGYNATITGSLTVLSTASANTAFRGVALAPVGAPDTTPPDTTIASGPSGSVNSTTANFTFTSTEAGSTFECSLDVSAFASCTTPVTLAGLSQGSHTFQVRAKDLAGNTDATPASRTWTVDTVAPNTTINTMPTDPTSDPTGDFTFSSNEAGSTFECSVDAGAFTACTSPFATASLANGAHTFAIRATDAAGNTDSTPASFGWTVSLAVVFNGPVSVGTGETITSLTNPGGLFQQMNAGTISGNVTVNITSDLTAETGTVALNQQVETGAGNWTIFFQASGGPRLIEGSNAIALINLNGADRVTFSGLALGGKSLLFRNTGNGSTFSFANDASSNSVINCTVEGGGSSIFFGFGAITGNDNNSVTDSIIRARTVGPAVPVYSIRSDSSPSNFRNSGIVIANNTITDFTISGVSLADAEDFTITANTFSQTAPRSNIGAIESDRSRGSNLIERNIISDMISGGTFTGIAVGEVGSTTISRNRIFNINGQTTSLGSFDGIVFLGSVANPSSVLVENNMIALAPSIPTDQAIAGLLDRSAAGNSFVAQHNTILIGGTSAGSQLSHGFLRTGSTPSIVTLTNNLFFNSRTGAGADHFAIADASPNQGSWSSNYNLFVGTGTTPANFFEYGLTPVDFAAWKAGPPMRDANSIASVAGAGPFNVANMFVSANDLHLNVGGNNPAINAGTSTGLTTDFDGQARPFNGLPDIGADEVQTVPTAADVSLSGRVADTNGRGIRNIRIVITGGNLAEQRTALTGSFGYFSFDGLRAGETYIVSVSGKRYVFVNPSRVVTLNDEAADVDFIGQPR